MNERVLNALQAATALGKTMPRAESSTSSPVEFYSVDPRSGVILLVTADTMAPLGGGYLLCGAGSAWIPQASKYYYQCGDPFDASIVAGEITTAGISYGTSGAATYTPTPSAAVNQSRQEALIAAVRSIFANAKISVTSHADEEEGWTRPLLQIDTGIGDPDKLDELEQKFYDFVERHETLTAALQSTTVLFL